MPPFPRLWQRALMLALNAIAPLHLILIVLAAMSPRIPFAWKGPVVLVLLYLLPPATGRVILAATRLREGHIPAGSGAFFAWWAVSNVQVLFSRFPFLEELLRTVPGLYGLWLRAWGAKVSSTVYWAPGLRILDRSYLSVGEMVVFGAGVRLNPHVFLRNEAGEMELVLATITLGNQCLVGGYSLLTAGTEFADGEVGKACLLSPPFSRWRGGRRVGRMGDTP